jgi:membrane peptidoglycan carboxypeptidase
VVEGGTGVAAQSAGREAAGKTGTAEEDRAAWFAGYTPDLATVVAVMGQDPDTGAQKPLYGATGLPRINGGGYPAQIWGQYTADALSGSPPMSFDLEPANGAEVPEPEPTTTFAPPPPTPEVQPEPTELPPSSAPPTVEPPTSIPSAPTDLPTEPTGIPSAPVITPQETGFLDGL